MTELLLYIETVLKSFGVFFFKENGANLVHIFVNHLKFLRPNSFITCIKILLCIYSSILINTKHRILHTQNLI